MLSLARVSGMQLNCGLHFFQNCRYLDGEDSSGDSLSDIVQVLDAMVHHCKEVNKIYKLEEDGKEELAHERDFSSFLLQFASDFRELESVVRSVTAWLGERPGGRDEVALLGEVSEPGFNETRAHIFLLRLLLKDHCQAGQGGGETEEVPSRQVGRSRC